MGVKKQHEQIAVDTVRKGGKNIMYKNEVFYKNNEKIIENMLLLKEKDNNVNFEY